MFGPYLCNKASRHDADIYAAVKLWCPDQVAAENKYGHISKWDISQVTQMANLFRDQTSFNDDIGQCDACKVRGMDCMFSGYKAFDQEIESRDVPEVAVMRGIFMRCAKVNRYIGDWDVRKVEDMEVMFLGAITFNQEIN